MTLAHFCLWADEGVRRTTFEWGRIQSNADWVLPIAVCVLILLFVERLYRRDAAELSRPVGWLLTALRSAVFLGLLVLWLQPQWRTEEERKINSRVALLVDTSMSMGIADDESGERTAAASRIEHVAAALGQSDLVERLRAVHDVTVYTFDEQLHRDRILTLPKRDRTTGAPDAESPPDFPPPRAAKPDAGEPRAGEAADRPVDWRAALRLGGQETRLGQALGELLSEESGKPLSGVLLISDGGQNAGVGPEPALQLARDAAVPIIAVGVGSDRLPPSVRVAAFDPPPRALPGDPYTVSGVVQSWRLPGQSVTVQLLSRPPDPPGAPPRRGTGTVIDSTEVTLGADGEEVPVRFEVTPDEVGRKMMVLRVLAPPSDGREEDDFLEAEMEVVDQKNRVLLLAGGPMRDYQYLRNQLYRDRSTTVDVLLQTGEPGMSQDADKLLDEFPSTREELYQYDCIVAFDPDWQALSAEQVGLIESWVAEQGGGLIVVAGPVHTGNAIRGWIEDESMAKIRALYPVEFQRRYAVLESRMVAAEEPWPLEFTREGMEADFLQPADSPTEGRQVWESFKGVYSYFPVRGAKQGAAVLARFSDPQTARDNELPVYFAWQFYGSGRVFYMGSGEMWRLREIDEIHFEKLYTKLIRHVSKGRLLRGSSRGMLLVGQERYWLGNTVQVQAYRLTDIRLEPLEQPSVDLQVIEPDQSVRTITMKPDPARPGSYVGQFAALKEGDYRLELLLPGGDEERLTQRIRVEIPDLERERPQRNDALLKEMAEKSGGDRPGGASRGKYVVGAEALVGPGASDLLASLEDRTKTIILTASPSRLWEETWLRWMMYTLCGLLAGEWLIRRLLKLA